MVKQEKVFRMEQHAMAETTTKKKMAKKEGTKDMEEKSAQWRETNQVEYATGARRQSEKKKPKQNGPSIGWQRKQYIYTYYILMYINGSGEQ